MRGVLFFVVAAVVLLAMVVILVFKGPAEDEQYLTSVTIRQIYHDSFSGKVTKVIYDAIGDDDLFVYRDDCLQHDGVFQGCGNICEPRATACVEVCAVTCTFAEA